jgi:cell shape-determining protein MreC
MFSRYKIIIVLFVLILLTLIMFFSLRHSGMSEDKFVEVYIQLSMAQVRFQNNPEKLEAERKKFFSEYKFSQKEMDRFLKSYKKNPEKWVTLWEKINQRLSELIESQRSGVAAR